MTVGVFDQLMHAGYINQHEHDFDSAYFCFDEALLVARSESERVEANICKATTLVMNGDFKTALDLLLTITASEPVAVITVSHLTANCQHSLNRFDKAKSAYLKALSACSHLPPNNWISQQIAANYVQLLADEKKATETFAQNRRQDNSHDQCA